MWVEIVGDKRGCKLQAVSGWAKDRDENLLFIREFDSVELMAQTMAMFIRVMMVTCLKCQGLGIGALVEGQVMLIVMQPAEMNTAGQYDN